MSGCPGYVLGFDYGTRRIGVAVGQTLTRTASPVAVLSHVGGRPDWRGIRSLIDAWAPELLVVGVPIHLDSAEHGVARAALRFARQLHGRYRLAVHTVDETLSSYEARRRIGGREALTVDAVAAQVILESWLQASPPRRVALDGHALHAP